MSGLKVLDIEHDCDTPSTVGLPNYDGQNRRRIVARWRCQVCGCRWEYGGYFGGFGHFAWTRSSKASRKWRKAEAQRRGLVSR